MANAATQTITSAAELAQENTKKTIAAVRKFNRARWGLYGTAYDALATRKIGLPKFSAGQLDDLAERGASLETEFQTLFEKTPKIVRQATPCGIATTLGFLPKRNEKRASELEAELEGVNEEIETLTKPAKKAAKATTKKSAKKSAPITDAKPARHIAYWENVKAYDADANEDIVRKIVNHCGIALNSNDGKFVACSDESERNTVRDSWLVRKLGLTASTEILDAKVLAVCESMKADRMKCRVTFYYLLAKAEGKLTAL